MNMLHSMLALSGLRIATSTRCISSSARAFHTSRRLPQEEGAQQQQQPGEPGPAVSDTPGESGTSGQQAAGQQHAQPQPRTPPRHADKQQRIQDISSKFRMNVDLRPDEGLSNTIGLVPEMERLQEFQHQLRLAERRLASRQAAQASSTAAPLSLEQRLKASLEQYR